MLCIEGRVALASFTVYALLALYQTRILYGDYWSYAYNLAIVGSASACVLILPYNSIVKRAAFLGMLFGGSIMLAILWNAPSRLFFIYLVFLSFFHFSEYMMTAIYNSHRLTLDSFLLNHSMEYQIAAVSSWIEFLVESYFFPSFKSMLLFNSIGFLFCFIGEILRKSAMITAKSNFSHIVQSSHNTGHKLVKSGIYAWTRHPSYVGWFVWSIGTQVLMCNPLCFLAYTVASWRFFNDRILDEEIHLLKFFGEEYVEYVKTVPTGIPFIYGCATFLKEKA